MNTLLRLLVTDLAARRGERMLFDALSFGLASGEGLTVTGPNGVGKTTLLRMIGGFIPPEGGRIALVGGDADIALAEAVHFVGHRDGLKSALTIRENLDLAPLFLGSPGWSVESAAERLSLLPLLDLPIGVLSAGQRRRAALARLLAAERPIWLLDEPTAALDAASTEIVAGMLKQHVAGGGMVVAATHLPLGVGGMELAFAADGTFAVRSAA